MVPLARSRPARAEILCRPSPRAGRRSPPSTAARARRACAMLRVATEYSTAPRPGADAGLGRGGGNEAMPLCRFKTAGGGTPRAGLLEGGQIRDLGGVDALASLDRILTTPVGALRDALAGLDTR